VSSSYQVRLFLPGDRPSLEDLYRAVYGQIWRERTNLAWTFDHPLNEAGAAVAVEGDTVVSAQPYCDFPLHTPWGTSRATLFLDVATHPAHQRRGLFRRVVAVARAAAFERGASIITTTPNRTAFQGFMTMPEWVHLCSLDCLVLPLGAGERLMGSSLTSRGARAALATASLLWKKLPTRAASAQRSEYAIKAPWSPGSDADELWRNATERAGIIVMRDRAFLQWRFGSLYRIFLARDAHRPAGYAAVRTITRAGLKIGMVLDCMTVSDGTCAPSLLESVIEWLRDQGASAAMGYFLRGSAPWHQVRAAGFLCLPRPFTPREYPVCANVRPEEPHSADLLNPSRWHMSLADSDLV
jgi:GNAT superfamily N-acetyltransferase